MTTKLDVGQIIRNIYDEGNNAIRITTINIIDGGNASSVYDIDIAIDGGVATGNTYSYKSTINGGNA